MERHKYDWERILGPDKVKPDTEVNLPPIFESCLLYLEQKALDVQGVFRVPGSARQVATLKDNFAKAKPGELIDLSAEEPFTICSLLGDYLRSEDPLLTYEKADEWINVAGVTDWILRMSKIAGLIEDLPVVNHAQLYLLLNLLVKVGKNADVTKMGNNNLGTIFGPMICRRKNSTPAAELRDVPRVTTLCIELLNRFEELFPSDEVDTIGRNQKRGGRNMGAGTPKRPVELPMATEDPTDKDASTGGGEASDSFAHVATPRPHERPLKSLSQMGAFYVKPKSPREGEGPDKPTKSSTKEALNLDSMLADNKKMDEEEARKRARTVGAISIKSTFDGRATVSGGRRPSNNIVSEEDVIQLRKLKTSKSDREKSSSAESADLFSEGEDGDGERSPFTFGGRTISLNKPKRRSTSWPEVEVAEFKRKMHKAAEQTEGETGGEKGESGEMTPEMEEEIRQQYEMKKKLLELKKKELESRKAEIIKRLESSGNAITSYEEKEKGDVPVNETGGDTTAKRKGSKDAKEDEEEVSESKLRRWKIRHQKIQEELKNIKVGSPRKSRSQRTKRSAKSDDEGLDEIEEKKYNSHDGSSSSSQKMRKRSDSDSSSEEEGNHVMHVIEKFYGKSKSAREARRSKSKTDLRAEKDKSPTGEAFPGIKCHTELDPPSEIKRRYSEEMKRSREAVAKKWKKQSKGKEDSPSEISGWQLEQLKKWQKEEDGGGGQDKDREKEAREGEKGTEKEEEKEGEEGEKDKKKKRKGSIRRKLLKKIEDEEKKLLEMNREALEGVVATGGQGN